MCGLSLRVDGGVGHDRIPWLLVLGRYRPRVGSAQDRPHRRITVPHPCGSRLRRENRFDAAVPDARSANMPLVLELGDRYVPCYRTSVSLQEVAAITGL